MLPVADLIEICFASTLDPDGREYLRHLRWASRDTHYLSWLQSAAERLASPLFGFVWEEDQHVVGNLSLIPMYRQGRILYLIANVAVHPDYRRRGIGHQLTEFALDYLRERGIHSAWLQVRDDNPTAVHLYQSLGFVEQARRSTWYADVHVAIPRLPLLNPIRVERRRTHDWQKQMRWLQKVYPSEVIWNLPLNIAHFRPDPWHRILSWLRGEPQEHWVALKEGNASGVISWEPARSLSDSLWLAAPREADPQVIEALLIHARNALIYRNKPLSVNYPAGQSEEAFYRSGFRHHQTLIWMEATI